MFCILGHVAIGFECIFVLLEPYSEAGPVCPTYALLQSGHVNLYSPDRACLSGGWCRGVSNFWMVLVVRTAILRSVFLNVLVMNVVSLQQNIEFSGFLTHFPSSMVEIKTKNFPHIPN
jgi:hypothetical protein